MKRFCIAAITCLALVVGVSPATAGSGLGGVPNTRHRDEPGEHERGRRRVGVECERDVAVERAGPDRGTAATPLPVSATAGGDGCCGSVAMRRVATPMAATSRSRRRRRTRTAPTQTASAESKAEQESPVNVNVGESGAGEQSNENSSGDASAWNKNHTGQSNEQFQKGVGGDATTGDATTGGSSGDADERQGSRRRRRPVAGGVELQQHVAVSDG